MYKIGVISDSHRKLQRSIVAIDLLISKNIDCFIHAGDIVDIGVIEYINSKKIPCISVFGNNDYDLLEYEDIYNIQKEPYRFILADKTFKLMHKPHYLTTDVDIIIFGHTHTFYADCTDNTILLNPGELCARDKNFSECALLKIKKDNTYDINHYQRETGTKIWNKTKYTFNID